MTKLIWMLCLCLFASACSGNPSNADSSQSTPAQREEISENTGDSEEITPAETETSKKPGSEDEESLQETDPQLEALPEEQIAEEPSRPEDVPEEAGQDLLDAGLFGLQDIPAWSGQPSIVVNNNQPFFSDDELTIISYEAYASLDVLGRVGWAMASIGKDLMPNTSRGDISSVRPSGWNNNPYSFIDGGYLYNRCHLIGWQLSGEDANSRNLLTGTRYLNVEGMLPYENRIADYVKSTGNHVVYRVTPFFDGNNLVAHGVLMEAKSVEDAGAGITFNVYCYNVQPGVAINYADGSNHADGTIAETAPVQNDSQSNVSSVPVTESTQTWSYVGNKNTMKFHVDSCSSVSDMKEHNKVFFTISRDEIIAQGYVPCKRCNP